MKWSTRFIALLSAVLVTLPAPGLAQPRIRDIVDVEGVRENDLVGYGIVVGLNGTGDSVKNSPFTEDSLSYMLERLGVNVQGEDIKPKNVAAVLVTATLPSFARNGSTIDVTVASIGDAKNLKGGTLILTPMKGADNEVYAVSQGSIVVSGIDVQAAGASVTRGSPTTGGIPNGARIEREINYAFNQRESVTLALRSPSQLQPAFPIRSILRSVRISHPCATPAPSIWTCRPFPTPLPACWRVSKTCLSRSPAQHVS
jgi:flagellar P-ring protein precursor FlgI